MAEITLTSAMRSNLLQLQQTNILMNRTQGRIASGRKVNSALDNPTAFFQAKGLTDNAKDLAVLKDAMGQSISTIQSADRGITAITELVEQAKALANSAKSTAVVSERLDLASQFDDLRTQIDKLAGDATYSGKNLIAGRGTISGGSFTVNSAAASANLTSVSAVAASSELREANFDITVQQLVQVTSDGSSNSLVFTAAVAINAAADLSMDNTDAITFKVFDASGALVATDTVTSDGTTNMNDVVADLTNITALGSVGTAAGDDGNNATLTFTMADGYTLKVEDAGTADSLDTAQFNTAIGTTLGFQSGADVTTVLDIDGTASTRLNVWAEGFSSSGDSNISLSISGTTLTITDGTNSAAVSLTTLFASDNSSNSDGTITQVTLGDMIVNLGVTGTLSDGGSMDGESTTVTKGLQTGTAGDFQFKVVSDGVTDLTAAIASTVITNSSFGATLTLTVTNPTTDLKAGDTTTVNLTNTGGTGDNDLKVTFNASGDASLNVQAVDATASGLSISAALSDWATDTNIATAIDQIDTALKTLRTNAQSLSTNLSVIQTREDFTSQFINTLEEGADKLTLADGNQEATNMLMLQTRQQLGIQALSMASQSAQAVLLLFR